MSNIVEVLLASWALDAIALASLQGGRSSVCGIRLWDLALVDWVSDAPSVLLQTEWRFSITPGVRLKISWRFR